MEIRNISRRRSRSSDYAELGHFTLLFCRGRLRYVPRIIMHEHSHCSTHIKTFCLVTLSLPSSSRLAQTSCFKIAKNGFTLCSQSSLIPRRNQNLISRYNIYKWTGDENEQSHQLNYIVKFSELTIDDL